jgi:thiol-disulfide isomerase/thioredoxin
MTVKQVAWGLLLSTGMYSCHTGNTPTVKKALFPFTVFGVGEKAIHLPAKNEQKGFVFLFLAPDCPLCQGYMPKIDSLASRFQGDSLSFFAVFPSKLYSDAEINQFVKDYTIPFAVLRDPDLQLSHFLKASITPEVVVLDRHGEPLYCGRIDNWAWEIGRTRIAATEHDLEQVLLAIQHGRAMPFHTLPAVGCSIEK